MPTLIISNFITGFETDNQPFLLDNTAFPVLNNALCFRGQVMRKPGSYLLNRAQRDLVDQSLLPSAASPWSIDVRTVLSLETYAQFIPGSLVLTVDGNVFTDDGEGTLSFDGNNHADVNYSSMTIDLTYNTAGVAVTLSFSYYPNLPILGFEDFIKDGAFPIPVVFDQKYSYQINQTPSPNELYDVNFYSTNGASGHHFVWSGATYQQFASASYHNVMFATNGKPGFHFIAITNVSSAANAVITTNSAHGLSNGDFVYINQVQGVIDTNETPDVSFINGYTFEVTVLTPTTFSIVLATNTAGVTAYGGGGIVQLLTQSLSTSLDGIRYYLGDPTVTPTLGWVNFSPPLTFYNADKTPTNSVDYLIGADFVIPFKDRLLFFGCTIATVNDASPAVSTQKVYASRVVYSQNGTPFYTQDPEGVGLLIPQNETAQREAWYSNVPARGGFITPPYFQSFKMVVPNFDVLLIALQFSFFKLIFTGDDSFPFIFQEISSEFGGQHIFSGISLEDGAVFAGLYAFGKASQAGVSRIDRKIRDQIYETAYRDNADQRVTAIRDFRSELIYFTMPLKSRPKAIYPTESFVYNYTEDNWASFTENYTHYGYFRPISSYTWATLPYRTWAEWTLPWNFGGQGERFPNVAAGNQQGFILIKDVNVKEGNSNFIFSISGATITSPDHCMNINDFIQIEGCIGTVGSLINNAIFKINSITQDTLTLDYPGTLSGTYLGGGVFKRIPNFNIQTKMFTPFWEQNFGMRIGVQRYLINATDAGQVTVDIFTSQNTKFASNDPAVSTYSPYTNILSTAPQSSSPFQAVQDFIWHRKNDSYIGDSIQLGFRLSDAQMMNINQNLADFTLQSIVIYYEPARFL